VNYQRIGGKTSDRIYELVEGTGKMKNSYPFVILNKIKKIKIVLLKNYRKTI